MKLVKCPDDNTIEGNDLAYFTVEAFEEFFK
jgi:hypothetical protein